MSTIQDRERIYINFDLFMANNIGGKGVGDLVSIQSAEDLDKLGDCFIDYFFNMRVRDKDGRPQWPKKGFAERIKSNLKMAVMEKHQIDLTDASNIPNFIEKW